jgi:hypothetical protein
VGDPPFPEEEERRNNAYLEFFALETKNEKGEPLLKNFLHQFSRKEEVEDGEKFLRSFVTVGKIGTVKKDRVEFKRFKTGEDLTLFLSYATGLETGQILLGRVIPYDGFFYLSPSTEVMDGKVGSLFQNLLKKELKGLEELELYLWGLYLNHLRRQFPSAYPEELVKWFLNRYREGGRKV